MSDKTYHDIHLQDKIVFTYKGPLDPFIHLTIDEGRMNVEKWIKIEEIERLIKFLTEVKQEYDDHRPS